MIEYVRTVVVFFYTRSCYKLSLQSQHRNCSSCSGYCRCIVIFCSYTCRFSPCYTYNLSCHSRRNYTSDLLISRLLLFNWNQKMVEPSSLLFAPNTTSCACRIVFTMASPKPLPTGFSPVV